METAHAIRPQRSSDAEALKQRGWWAVFVLNLLFICSFVDRQIINFMVEPMQRDLGLTDTQMSLLMGPAFAVFYVVMGLPMGILADRLPRKGLIAAGAALWSTLTVACGMASTYAQLLLLRVGVGIGEASLGPGAYSMIADYFDKTALARALSVMSMGVVLGGGLASIIGGSVVAASLSSTMFEVPLLGWFRPWQLVFVIVGLPGILLAAAALLLKEPPRRHAAADGAPVSLYSHLGAQRQAYASHMLGFGLLTLCAYGVSAWLPTYLTRVRGIDIQTVGLVMGGGTAVFGCAGMLFFGSLCDWLIRRGVVDAAFLIGAAMSAALCAVVALVVAPIEVEFAFVGILAMSFLIGAWNGVALASLQLITPSGLRGQFVALYLIIINVLGLGLGPPAVAFFTDHVFDSSRSVGTSILIVAGASTSLSIMLFLSGRAAYCRAVNALPAGTKD